MASKPPPKDDALETLDFIISVLREHEKELDRLVSELEKAVEKFGGAGELDGKIQNVEKRIAALQAEVAKLISYLSASSRTAHPMATAQAASQTVKATPEVGGTPVRLKCSRWEDFQAQARQAQTVSFTWMGAENKVQVDALKGNQIITYVGECPATIALLKTWLSRQLEVPEGRVLEGTLSIG